MGDPKRFWRESIGVVGADSDGPTGSARPRVPASSRPPADAPEGIEQILARLPVGSVRFADEAAQVLWPEPTAEDLKNVAVIADEQYRLPAPVRELAVRCLALRQRSERLKAAPLPAGLDPAVLGARGAEWTRVSAATREALAALDATPEVPSLVAARGLMADPADIDAEAAVAAEIHALAEIAHGLRTPADPTLLEFDEARALFQRLEAGRPDPLDAVFLEVLALFSMAQRPAAAPAEMDRQRRGVERLEARLEGEVERAMNDHRRDADRNQRLARWRRCLLETRTRLDERMTRRAAAAQVEESPRAVRDEAAVELLRSVRARAQARGSRAATVEPAAAPASGWRRWFGR